LEDKAFAELYPMEDPPPYDDEPKALSAWAWQPSGMDGFF
jgi:hypothetical protein